MFPLMMPLLVFQVAHTRFVLFLLPFLCSIFDLVLRIGIELPDFDWPTDPGLMFLALCIQNYNCLMFFRIEGLASIQAFHGTRAILNVDLLGTPHNFLGPEGTCRGMDSEII